MMIVIISWIIVLNYGVLDFVNFVNKWLNGNNFFLVIVYGMCILVIV